MKELFVKWIYSVLDCMPERIMVKLKMICNVCVHDWRMDPFPFFDLRPFMPEAMARSFFDASDEETMEVLHWQYQVGQLHVEPEDRCFFFYNYTHLLPKVSCGLRQGISDAGRLFVRATGCRDAGPETFYYRHGLACLSAADRESLRGKAVVDAGAYHGESIVVFQELGPSTILAFEPSVSNMAMIPAVLKRNGIPEEAVELIPKGLSDCQKTILISDGGGAGFSIVEEGGTPCQISTLDEEVSRRNVAVGMIKADVEGECLRLIRGAEGVIRRDLPLLSLAVYHSPDEFLGIPQLLSEWNLGYRIRLRRMNPLINQGEVCILAIPPWMGQNA